MKRRLNRCVSILLVVCILSLGFVIGVSATDVPCFALGSVSGSTGDEVEIYLSILNNPGITALRLEIGYSADDLELLGVSGTNLFEESVDVGQLNSNPIILSWFARSSNDDNHSGDLAVLRFRIKDNAHNSTVTVSYDEDDVFNSKLEGFYFDTENAVVTVLNAVEVPTEASTEATTEELTEAPTEVLTEEPTLPPADAPRFELTSAQGKIGDEVELDLNIHNNPGITAFRLSISYPKEYIELLDIYDMNLFPSSITKGQLTVSPVRISWYSTSSADEKVNGTVAVLRFRIKNGAKNSVITIDYDEDDVFNTKFDAINFAVTDGVISVENAQEPTETPTEATTEAPTETSTEASTEALTEAPHRHTLSWVSEVPATYEANGFKSHYVCSECKKMFLDAAGVISVNDSYLVIPKLVPTEPTTNPGIAVTFILGDANGDGFVTISDVTRIQRILVNLDDDIDGMIALRGSLNGEALNIDHATMIQYWLARFEVEEPIGEEVTRVLS